MPRRFTQNGSAFYSAILSLIGLAGCHDKADPPPPPPTFLETHSWLLGEWFADVALIPSQEIVGHGFLYVNPGRTSEEMSWLMLLIPEPGASVAPCPVAFRGFARRGPRGGGVVWENATQGMTTFFFPTPERIACVFSSPCSVETFGFLAVPLP